LDHLIRSAEEALGDDQPEGLGHHRRCADATPAAWQRTKGATEMTTRIEKRIAIPASPVNSWKCYSEGQQAH
jgi:hypothetical protein